MAVYADFTGYKEQFLGAAIAESDFPRLARRASEEIDRLTFGRAAPIVAAGVDEATIQQITFAACAVAEVIQQLDASGGAVQSESIGKSAVVYASPKSAEAQKAAAARAYLGATGLMYRGV